MSGVLDALTWQGAAVVLLVVFVVRPLAGLVALLRSAPLMGLPDNEGKRH